MYPRSASEHPGTEPGPASAPQRAGRSRTTKMKHATLYEALWAHRETLINSDPRRTPLFDAFLQARSASRHLTRLREILAEIQQDYEAPDDYDEVCEDTRQLLALQAAVEVALAAMQGVTL